MKKISKLQRLINKCVKLAGDKKLEIEPDCVFCEKPAGITHHFIHQSRSNFLRCDFRNLIPICKNCHWKLHQRDESLMAGILIRKYGQEWFNELEHDSHISIRSSLGYWRNMLEQLEIGT